MLFTQVSASATGRLEDDIAGGFVAIKLFELVRDKSLDYCGPDSAAQLCSPLLGSISIHLMADPTWDETERPRLFPGWPRVTR